MNKGIIYIDYDEALNIYGKMIDASDGGFEGVRDEGGIRATLDFVQNDLYYPTFADKLTYLMYRFCSGHFFNDGNKRIALTLGAYFLHKNNYYWHACIVNGLFFCEESWVTQSRAVSRIGKVLPKEIIGTKDQSTNIVHPQTDRTKLSCQKHETSYF